MYYIIVNPASKSGRGAKIWLQLKPILEEKNIAYKALFSEEAGQVIKMVQDLTASLLNDASDEIV